MDNPNAKFIVSLRDLADFLEAHPIKEVRRQTVHVFCDSRQEFADELRKIGRAEKEYGAEWFWARKTFGPIELQLSIERNLLCERVKTGERVIPAQPERTLPAEPERVEEVYEWKCPESILAPRDGDS